MSPLAVALALFGVACASENTDVFSFSSMTRAIVNSVVVKDSSSSPVSREALHAMLVPTASAGAIETVDKMTEDRVHYTASIAKASQLATVQALYEEGALSFDESVAILSTARLYREVSLSECTTAPCVISVEKIVSAWSAPFNPILKTSSDLGTTSGDRTHSSCSSVSVASQSSEILDNDSMRSTMTENRGRPPLSFSHRRRIQPVQQGAIAFVSPMDRCIERILARFQNEREMFAVARECFVDSNEISVEQLASKARELRTAIVHRRLLEAEPYVTAMRLSANKQMAAGWVGNDSRDVALASLDVIADCNPETVTAKDIAPAVRFAMRFSPNAYFSFLAIGMAIDVRDSSIEGYDSLMLASIIVSSLRDL